MKRKKILFCYISHRSGHRRVADVVRKALAEQAPRVATEGINTISYAPSWVGEGVTALYLQVLQVAPGLWQFLYDNPQVEELTRELRLQLITPSLPRLLNILKKHEPDLLVCTQAVPLSVLAHLKEQGKLRIPLAAILTDFGAHTYWVSPAVDLYLLPTEEVRCSLLQRGVSPERIRVTGIPIDPAFSRPLPQAVARHQLGIGLEEFTALLMGGTLGLGPMEKAVEVLRSALPDLQLLIVCGENRDLQRRLEKRHSGDPRVRLWGKSKDVPRLMAAADVLISKPGGLTSAEAMAAGLPLFMLQPLPGQEERNAVYLSRLGVAERVSDVATLGTTLKNKYQHPDQLKKFREKSLRWARPKSAQEAAGALMGFL